MWKKCSSCKSDIDFGQAYWQCSVSTCQRSRTALYFCSVACWDAHLATANHREAWAVDRRAPTREQWQREEREPTSGSSSSSSSRSEGTRSAVVERAPTPAVIKRSASDESAGRRIVAAPAPGPLELSEAEKDILIVVSKLKKYIRDRSGLKTSDGCAAILSDHVRILCDRAIQNAHQAERKTVLDRDFSGVL